MKYTFTIFLRNKICFLGGLWINNSIFYPLTLNLHITENVLHFHIFFKKHHLVWFISCLIINHTKTIVLQGNILCVIRIHWTDEMERHRLICNGDVDSCRTLPTVPLCQATLDVISVIISVWCAGSIALLAGSSLASFPHYRSQ